MRAVNFVVPDFSNEDWATLEKVYNTDGKPEAQQKEEKLMAASADAGRRGFLSREEFLAIACWKSPRPKARYELNSHEEIKAVTNRAFAAVSNVEKVLELTHLSGINVRSASAILHLCFPEAYPLMDVRAMAALGICNDEVDNWDELAWLRAWTPYIQLCRGLAQHLDMPLRKIDRALWAKGRAVTNQLREKINGTQNQNP